MRAAVVNWQIQETGSVDEFFDHCERLLKRCDEAELVVMPEFTSLELLGSSPSLPQDAIAPFLAGLLEPQFHRFGELAHEFCCTLVAGTHFIHSKKGIVNSAIVATPDGHITTDVPKVAMTRFEKDEWGIQAGDGLRRLTDQRIGVNVCYDCEFPLAAQVLAEAGTLALCVPAYTESRRGFQRVRWSCQARAIENQFYVLHASLVGSLGREPVVGTYGSSAILAPSVEPYPETAVLAETEFGTEGVAIAEIDFDLIELGRNSNDVRNWHDRHQQWALNEAFWVRSSTP